MTDQPIAFVGGGRITRIILEGWSRAGYALDRLNLTVSEPDTPIREALAERFPTLRTVSTNEEAVSGAKLVFLAIHPPVMGEALAPLAGVLAPEAILVSLAPKFTITKLTSLLGGFDRISRCIPNAPSIIGAGFNPVAHGAALAPEDRALVAEALSPLGGAPEVPEERLEAYAVISAMGPTYFWFQLQTLRELASEFGLSDDEASEALRALFAGTAETLLGSGLEATEVMDLIPVKPMQAAEETITASLRDRLREIHAKIAPV